MEISRLKLRGSFSATLSYDLPLPDQLEVLVVGAHKRRCRGHNIVFPAILPEHLARRVDRDDLHPDGSGEGDIAEGDAEFHSGIEGYREFVRVQCP